MLAIRSSVGQSRYVASEWDAVFRTAMSRTPMVWFHGNNATGLGDYTSYNPEFRIMAQRHVVMEGDLGFNPFGNDLGITRAGQALDYLATLGYDQPAILVGASMGNTNSMNFALRYPERVAALVGIIPALTLWAPPGHPAKATIDAAYPPAYDPGNPDHFSHDPLGFAADLPEDLPVGIWYSTNDTLCLPETAIAFEAARPQTHTVAFGAYGHGGINVATPLAEAWLKGLG